MTNPQKRTLPKQPPETKKIINKSILEELIEEAIPVHYVRFHSNIAPAVDKEPVAEFYLKSKIPNSKYLVESLYWVPGKCLIWKAFGELDACEASTVMFVRITQ
jgi:hypothetical protein